MENMLEKRSENEAAKLASTSTRFHSALAIHDFSPSLEIPEFWSRLSGNSESAESGVLPAAVLHPTNQPSRHAAHAAGLNR